MDVVKVRRNTSQQRVTLAMLSKITSTTTATTTATTTTTKTTTKRTTTTTTTSSTSDQTASWMMPLPYQRPKLNVDCQKILYHDDEEGVNKQQQTTYNKTTPISFISTVKHYLGQLTLHKQFCTKKNVISRA